MGGNVGAVGAVVGEIVGTTVGFGVVGVTVGRAVGCIDGAAVGCSMGGCVHADDWHVPGQIWKVKLEHADKIGTPASI